MSHVASYYPVIAALRAAEGMPGMGGSGIPWHGSNDEQRLFLARVFSQCYDDAATLPELETIASRSVAEINAFLASKGFDISLQPIGPQDFAVASVLDLLVEWLAEGTRTTVETPQGVFAGVKLSEHALEMYTSSGHPHKIAVISTKSTDKVCMTMVDKAPPTGMGLIDMVSRFSDMSPSYGNGGLIFPMVDLDLKEDMTWILGLSAQAQDGRPAIISQAVRQDKLRMNHLGARAQSAVAMAVTRGMSPRPLVIDRPFIVWSEREGVPFPIFSAYVTQEHWREPATLD